MRTFGPALCVALAITIAARADEANEKICIFAAARKLPPVPGLVVKKSTATKSDFDDTNVQEYFVELEIEAAAKSATVLYRCTTLSGNVLTIEQQGMR